MMTDELKALKVGDTVTKINSYDFDTVQDGELGKVIYTDEQVISVLFEGQPFESLVPLNKLELVTHKSDTAKAEGAKPETISAAEFVAGDYAAKIAAGECKVSSSHADIKIVTKCEGEGNTEYKIHYGIFNGYCAANHPFNVRWLDTTPTAPAKAAVGEDWQAAAKCNHDLWVAEKDRYQRLYRDFIDLQQFYESDTGYVFDASARLFGSPTINSEDGSQPTFDETVEHWERETSRLQAALDAERATVARLREANAKLLKLVKGIDDSDYSKHSDFVKARELEMWQEHAENLIAELEEAEAVNAVSLFPTIDGFKLVVYQAPHSWYARYYRDGYNLNTDEPVVSVSADTPTEAISKARAALEQAEAVNAAL
jgi:hypothetical protein